MKPSQRPLGLLLIGGLDSKYKGLASVEVIGLDNCSVPDLPEFRYDHGSFLTEWGSFAVCGGWWASKPLSSDCLVFNTATRQWERGVLGAILGNTVLGVVNMDVGTYMVHHFTSSFLPAGKLEWIDGPSSPEVVQCATGIFASSFLAFGKKSVRQFDSNIAGPRSEEGWVADGEWPNLQEERYGPGCATLDDMSILAGGRNQLGEPLKSVEIIFLNTKRSGKARDMMEPRDHFNLVVLGSTLLALGGYNQTSMEMWEGVGRPWTEASMSLTNARSQFSALTFSDSLCSAGPLPPHSCPTVDGGTCVFPFTFTSGSKTSSSCVSEDNQSFWCSTPARTWAQCDPQRCPLESDKRGLYCTRPTFMQCNLKINFIANPVLRILALSSHSVCSSCRVTSNFSPSAIL